MFPHLKLLQAGCKSQICSPIVLQSCSIFCSRAAYGEFKLQIWSSLSKYATSCITNFFSLLYPFDSIIVKNSNCIPNMQPHSIISIWKWRWVIGVTQLHLRIFHRIFFEGAYKMQPPIGDILKKIIWWNDVCRNCTSAICFHNVCCMQKYLYSICFWLVWPWFFFLKSSFKKERISCPN